MTKAFRHKVKIHSGGVLEIHSHDLPEGIEAEVIVLIEESSKPPQPLSRLIGTAKGCYRSPDEADAFLRQERDRWD